MATESFFSNASLAYLASAGAGKDGKTYSIKPTDGSGDFTFSRGSNLAATRVGPTGLIEKGRENLLLQSNTFSNASWLKELGTTLTSGQSGYDGSSDAWLLDTDGTQFSRLRQTLSSNGVQTFSIYAKAGTLDWIGLYNGGASGNAFFDLNNGVTGNSNAIIDTSITSVGNGWYRCEYSSNQSITDVRIYLTDANGTFTTTAGNIYIQDAQLEIGLAATEVITTGATTGKAGLLEDEPRFDYSGGATCPSLLLEPSRTNLIGQSEYLGGWQIPANYTNTTTTDKQGIQVKSIYGRAIHKSIIVTSGETHSVSFYAKKDTWEFFFINTQNWDSSATGYTWFNLATGNVGTASPNHGTPTMTPEGNGWYRCTIYFSSTTDLSGNIVGGIVESNGSYTLGTNDQESAFFTMAQVEEGSYPTSYIPNHSGGSVTRGADGISKDLTSVVNGNQMTMFLDLKSHISIGTQTNALWGDLRWYHKSNNRILFYKNDDAINIGGDITINGRTKIALSITTTDAKVFVNGSQVYTTSLPTPFVDFGELIYEILNSKEEWNQFLIFSTPLSDADCINITSL